MRVRFLIRRVVAVLADAFSIVAFFLVDALPGAFITAAVVVAIVTHVFSIVLAFNMRALSDSLGRFGSFSGAEEVTVLVERDKFTATLLVTRHFRDFYFRFLPLSLNLSF
jgi:hypothetical protein